MLASWGHAFKDAMHLAASVFSCFGLWSSGCDILQNTVGGGKPKMRWHFGKNGWPTYKKDGVTQPVPTTSPGHFHFPCHVAFPLHIFSGPLVMNLFVVVVVVLFSTYVRLFFLVLDETSHFHAC